MLSKKLTFSLASLVMLFAIGLVGVSPATAGVLGDKFGTTLSVTDVSSEGGNQVEVAGEGTDDPIIVNIVFAKEVTYNAAAGADPNKAAFGVDDIAITLYDENRLAIATPSDTDLTKALSLTSDTTDTALATANDGITASKFKLQIGGPAVAAALGENRTLVVVIDRGKAQNANRVDVNKAATSDDTLGSNERALIDIELVAADPATSDPTVISITSVVPQTETDFKSKGVRGPFNVRVLLSEMPKEFKADHIEVANGKVTAVVAGAPIAVLTGDDAVPLVTDDSTTGRDNMAHPFLVSITPDLKNENDIVISVKDFEDTKLPIPGKYARGLVDNLVDLVSTLR